MTSTLLRALLLIPLSINATPLVAKRDYPAAGACSGVCQGRLHDPSVIYSKDTDLYYRFTTNDGLHTATAPSMSGPWTDRGAALPQGSIINLPGNKDLWSPDVFQIDGTYYLYYAVSKIGSSNSDIGVATSDSLDPGSWTDHGSIGIPQSSSYNRIDPNLYMYDPKTPVLDFGSFWQDIYQIPMQIPPLKVASTGATHIAQNTTARPAGLTAGAEEGSYLFWWNDYVYLFLSGGNCCNEPAGGRGLAPPGEEYHISVCRSTSASGGFVDQQGRDCLNGGGTLVLGSHGDVYAPGGQGVMYDPKLRSPVIYYHYVRPSVSYGYDDFFFGWNQLDFSSGWPVVVA